MIVLGLFIASYQNKFGLVDLQHQIGKFLPSRPLDFFKPDEVREIYKRLDELEYQVGNIKRAPDFSKSIVRIEELLPDFLFVKKDESGEVQIPKDFWHALRDRIRMVSQEARHGVSKPGRMERQASRDADRFKETLPRYSGRSGLPH